MTKYYHKDFDDFYESLIEQLELIVDYCKFIDSGEYKYIKPLATSLRVLFHQTKHSKSLLYSLGLYNSIEMISTSKEFRTPFVILKKMTMVSPSIKFVTKNNKLSKEAIFVPNLYASLNDFRNLSIEDWYKNDKLIILSGNHKGLIKLYPEKDEMIELTRYKIIDFFANKEGGAHIDPKISKDLMEISREISSLEYFDTALPGPEKYKPGISVKYGLQAVLRQIAHETIMSFRRAFDLKVEYNPSYIEILNHPDPSYKQEINIYCVIINPVTNEITHLN